MEHLMQEPKFWVAVSFVIFIVVMWKPFGVFAMIAKALDSRSEKIKAELDAAVALRLEAQATLQAYLQKQTEVLKEAEEILAKTKSDAEIMARAAREELKSSLEKRTRMAMEHIAQAEGKAVKDVQNHMVDIAMVASRAIIKEYAQRTGGEELVKLASAEIERKMH